MRKAAAALAVLLGAAAPARAESPHILYMLYCSGCHGADGSGSDLGGIPPMPGIVGHFLRQERGRLYLSHVPGVVNAGLADRDIAALLNWILATQGKGSTPAGAKPFDEDEVKRLRAQPVHDVVALRREIAADLRRSGIEIGDYPKAR